MSASCCARSTIRSTVCPNGFSWSTNSGEKCFALCCSWSWDYWNVQIHAFWRLTLYKVVGTGPWTEANVYITYIYMHLYVLSQWLVVLKKGVARYMCNASIPIWYLLNIFIVARDIVCYSIRWQCHGDLQSQVDKKLYCKQCRWKRLSILLPIGKSIYSPNQ